MNAKVFEFVFFMSVLFAFEKSANGLPTQQPTTDVDDYVIGGRTAPKGKFPFMVSLQLNMNGGFNPYCGGSILTKNWIITAAHCAAPFKKVINNIFVSAGVTNLEDSDSEQLVGVQEIHTHERYESNKIGSDLALLKLKSALNFNEHVQAIHLPEENSEPSGNGLILGWGNTESPAPGEGKDDQDFSSTVLQMSEISVVQMDYCKKEWYRATYLWQDETELICLGVSNGKQQACDGDSGGPFVQYKDGHPVIEGVFSMGNKTCTAIPSLYIKASKFLSWINSTVVGKPQA